jgi:ribosome-associated protein
VKKKKITKAPVKKPARGKIKKPVAVARRKKALVKPAAKPSVKPIAKQLKGGLPEQLYNAALKVLDERQAENVVSFSLQGRSSMADYIVIASARAARQAAAIAQYLREAFAKLGVHPVRIEGLPEANWVLIDAGDVVVHVFRPEVRRYYALDDIWSAAGK